MSKPDQPASTETETTPVESTSPLLSSLLKSPTSLASNLIAVANSSIPILLDIDEKKSEEKMEIDEVPETGENNPVVVPVKVEEETAVVDENDVVVDIVVEKEINGYMPKPEENVEEPLVLPQVNVETNSTIPPDSINEEETKIEEETIKESDLDLLEDLVDILDGEKNGTEEISSSSVVNDVNQKEESTSEQQPIDETTVKLEVEDEKESEINSSTTEQTSDNETVQNNDHDDIKVENISQQETVGEVIPAEAENGKDHDDDEIKAEIVDEKNNKESDEDKPLTSISETKRTTRMSLSSSTSTPASKTVRRPRKQSDIVDEEAGASEDTPLRRETRSKKNSERSDETGLGGLEAASEESPLPPPLSGIRETRRSAAKKAQVILPASSNSNSGEIPVMDDLESSKEEKDESSTATPTATTPQSVAENRRVSRLKEKEASGKFLKELTNITLRGKQSSSCMELFVPRIQTKIMNTY